MNVLKSFGLFIVLIAAFFTSCEKDSMDEPAQYNPDNQVDVIEVNPLARNLTASSDFIIIDCIRIPYPVDFLQASGSTITVNNEAELDAATMLADSIVDFVYPFDVLDDDDNEITISKVDDLGTALINCASVPDPNPCAYTDAHVLLFYNAFNIFTINQ